MGRGGLEACFLIVEGPESRKEQSLGQDKGNGQASQLSANRVYIVVGLCLHLKCHKFQQFKHSFHNVLHCPKWLLDYLYLFYMGGMLVLKSSSRLF